MTQEFDTRGTMFDLKTSLLELDSMNVGKSQEKFEQYPPTRDITGNNFPNGAIHIRWQVSGTKWWVPSKSYIRLRATLTDGGDAQLTSDAGIAPNMGTMANLFQSAEFRINNTTVSRVSDFMGQIDALETRITKSKSWLDSVGKSTNFWQASLDERISEVSSDGVKPSVTKTIVLTGAPEMGLDAANTYAYVNATGVLTLAAGAGAAIPANILKAGDVLVLNGETYVISSVGAVADTYIAVSTVGADVPATVIPANGTLTRTISTKSSRAVSGHEFIWQPPLGIFGIDHALPAGDYELVLNPQTTSSYQIRAVESLQARTPDVDFKFGVIDMYMLVATVNGPRVDDANYLIDLSETRCQVDNVDFGGNFQQKNFDVSPSTFALTLAFQNAGAGNSTIASSSKLKMIDDADLTLNRMFLNYGGQNKPQPDADPQYKVVDAEDYTIQRYAETHMHSGAYHMDGGAETIEEWHERGPYYHFAWARDGADRCTRVNAHFGFNGAVANGRVLLFDHYKKVANVRVSGGRVVGVNVTNQ